MFSAAFLLYLVLFLQCFTYILAIDIERFRHSLGIGRNQLMQENPPVNFGGRLNKKWQYLIYSGYAKFSTDTNDLFDDEQLAGLGQWRTQTSSITPLTSLPAWQAYEEMHYDYDNLRTSCGAAGFGLMTNMPILIAALAVDDEIFFSSQLKGTDGHDFVYSYVLDVEIKKQLSLWYSLLNFKVDSGTEQSLSRAYLVSEELTLRFRVLKKTIKPRLVLRLRRLPCI